MAFWCGVSAVAGALRRRVWLDMAYFKWFPNFYVILVAPPGIVSKSTTAAVAMNLLRQVPNVRFGPDVVTWQALVQSLASSAEAFQLPDGTFETMSPVTIESGELGNLLNPQDREMVDLLVTLWDGRAKFSKITKMSGNDEVANPWINIIACTTPSWIAGNVPEYLVGGGLTSRCVFIFADKKERYVAYPYLEVPASLREQERALVEDLTQIASLCGAYRLTPEATDWGVAWYREHYEKRPDGLDDDRFGGYIARKQTHIHKLAMVIAAAHRDELVVTLEDIVTAHTMVTDLEQDMPQVFAKIGKGDAAATSDRFISLLKRRGGMPYEEAIRWFYSYFPNNHDLEGMLAGMMRSGLVSMKQIENGKTILTATLNSP